MIVTIITEYVPVNDITSSSGNGTLLVYLQRPLTILIPVRGFVNELKYPLQATIFYNKSLLSIDRVRLSTSSDSILTYYNSDSNLNTTSPTKAIYTLDVRGKHTGLIGNTSNLYNLDIFYTYNSTGHGKFSAPFNWPIKTLDFNIIVYFFIAFIGVMVSRYTSKLSKSRNGDVERDPSHFKQVDGAWILISGVIALLIFSSFQEQVNLTSLLITNISLAFAFGFGFDKILQTGSNTIR